MSSFELKKPDWYTPKIVTENDYLNEKLENTNFGIYYSVQFEGDADTYLWQAKTAPAVGEKVWGHIEQSSSGKSMRFKKDKTDSGVMDAFKGSGPNYQNTSNNITLGLVYKTVANIRGLPENLEDKSIFWEMVKEHTEELIAIGEKLNADPLVEEAKKVFEDEQS